MAEEFLALQKQGTWHLEPPPPNAQVLGCKWTFHKKFNADGSIARFKARLVAQGNQQAHGIDYAETFSPVAKIPTIRVLFTVALFHSWTVQQWDVSNAFLHGQLNDTVYMNQPWWFTDENYPNHVCRLLKSIYGLRQAPRQWYTMFTNHLLKLGFDYSKADPSLLTLHRDKTRIFLLVYVDDILVTSNDDKAISSVLMELQSKFNMKDLGPAHHFLGIKIQKHSDKYFLSQSSYAESILSSVNLNNCNPLSNPSCTKLPDQMPDDAILSDPTTYRRVTGSLQYLTLTRPDITHAVNVLAQHLHDPTPQHSYLLKRLLRYIKGTVKLGLPILPGPLTLSTYSDADWAGDPNTRKSTTGHCTFLDNTLISWTVKKQNTVARSSTESEYRALAAATADTI
ncbi:uncharacterized protein LOC110104543 [Dendrobium catenatum]|uniref:uncharacterized protein LOC110104543 n=1 Tax=Dendrobium catenatum TaxID=906689 RepID=UPI0009F72EBD|nr:uncharacterized protein LOC110104543 [Dendrobium catenatum]